MSEHNITWLQDRLGYVFKDPAFILQALTHKSYANENRGEGASHNERLEFLGDTVLDFVISDFIMQICPDSLEGDLSKLRAVVVSETNLSRVARSVGLGGYLRLGKGEEWTGGREKSSLLANALEALIAAVYLDGGVLSAKDLILRLFGDDIQSMAAGGFVHDPKTDLQELCQGEFGVLPDYIVVGESGPDHQKVFEVEIKAAGRTMGRGAGRSKKEAEQSAASAALDELKDRR